MNTTETKIVTLLAGAYNIRLDASQSTDEQTVILFNCPLYPEKACIHIVTGAYRLKRTQRNIVTLVSKNNIIKMP